MMTLKIKKVPEYACKEIEKVPFDKENIRRCVVSINEEDAFTYMHPESFYFSDIYGDCELTQVGQELPVFISRFQFEKNVRSFEQEAADQTINGDKS